MIWNWKPSSCPYCWANLKKQGYPRIHQHNDTGNECEFILEDDLTEEEAVKIIREALTNNENYRRFNAAFGNVTDCS